MEQKKGKTILLWPSLTGISWEITFMANQSGDANRAASDQLAITASLVFNSLLKQSIEVSREQVIYV